MKRIFAFFLMPFLTWAQCPANYGFYRTITINSAQVSGSSQTNFPMLLLNPSASLATVANGGKVQSSSGFDIVVTNADASGNVLSFEGVGLGGAASTYTASNGNIELWAKVPSISSSALAGYLVYGNASIAGYQGSTAAWNANFQAVYHLGNGTTLSLADSTSNGHTLTNNGSATAGAGKIGGGVVLNGTSQYLSVTGTSFASNPVTLTGWGKTTDLTNVTTLASIGDALGDIFKRLFVYGAHSAHFSMQEQNHATQGISEAGAISSGVFFHGTGDFTSTTSRVASFNGTAGTADTTNISAASPTVLFVGANDNGNGGTFTPEYWSGTADEIHVYNGTLPSGWLTTEVNNQSAPGSFYTLGSETACPGAPTPTVRRRIIARRIPFDVFPEVVNAR